MCAQFLCKSMHCVDILYSLCIRYFQCLAVLLLLLMYEGVCGCVCRCRALQHVVERCGIAFEPHLTSDLLQLVFTCVSHTNRFVRETGYRVIAAFISIPGGYILHCVCASVTIMTNDYTS